MTHELTPGTLLIDDIEVLSRIGGDDDEGRYLAKRIEARGHVLVHALASPAAGPELALQEFELAHELVHSGLPQRLGVGRANDSTIFFAEGYPTGDLLSVLIRKTVGSASDLVVARRAHQILSVLAAAHETGVYHGRLNPSSVLVERAEGHDEHVRLLGLGVLQSYIIARDAIPVLDSHGYCPPEVLSGDVDPNPATDLYAVGAMILAMHSGSRSVVSISEGRVVKKKARQSVFGSILKKALAIDPTERFGDVGEMLGEVDRLMRKLSRHEGEDAVEDHVGFDSSLSAAVGRSGAVDVPMADDEPSSETDADWMSLLPENSSAPGRHSTLAALEAELAFSGADESRFDDLLSRATGDDASTKVTGPPPDMRHNAKQLSRLPPLAPFKPADTPPPAAEPEATDEDDKVETTSPGRPSAHNLKRVERTRAATPAAKQIGERDLTDASDVVQVVDLPAELLEANAAADVKSDAPAAKAPVGVPPVGKVPLGTALSTEVPIGTPAGAPSGKKEIPRGVAVRGAPPIGAPADDDTSVEEVVSGGIPLPESESGEAIALSSADVIDASGTAVRRRPTIENPPPPPENVDEVSDEERALDAPRVESTEIKRRPAVMADSGERDAVPPGAPVTAPLATKPAAGPSLEETLNQNADGAVSGDLAGIPVGRPLSGDFEVQQLDVDSGDIQAVSDDESAEETETSESLTAPPPPPEGAPTDAGTFEVMSVLDSDEHEIEEDDEDLLPVRDPEPENEVEVREYTLKSAAEINDVIPTDVPVEVKSSGPGAREVIYLIAAVALVGVLWLIGSSLGSSDKEADVDQSSSTSESTSSEANTAKGTAASDMSSLPDPVAEQADVSAVAAVDTAADLAAAEPVSLAAVTTAGGSSGMVLGERLAATFQSAGASAGDPVVPNAELPDADAIPDPPVGDQIASTDPDEAKREARREERRKRREERRNRKNKDDNKTKDDPEKDSTGGFLDVKVD